MSETPEAKRLREDREEEARKKKETEDAIRKEFTSWWESIFPKFIPAPAGLRVMASQFAGHIGSWMQLINDFIAPWLTPTSYKIGHFITEGSITEDDGVKTKVLDKIKKSLEGALSDYPGGTDAAKSMASTLTDKIKKAIKGEFIDLSGSIPNWFTGNTERANYAAIRIHEKVHGIILDDLKTRFPDMKSATQLAQMSTYAESVAAQVSGLPARANPAEEYPKDKVADKNTTGFSGYINGMLTRLSRSQTRGRGVSGEQIADNNNLGAETLTFGARPAVTGELAGAAQRQAQLEAARSQAQSILIADLVKEFGEANVADDRKARIVAVVRHKEFKPEQAQALRDALGKSEWEAIFNFKPSSATAPLTVESLQIDENNNVTAEYAGGRSQTLRPAATR